MEPVESPAERQYRKHKEYMKSLYERKKDTWNLKRMEKYRLEHPNPSPRGRPRKYFDPPYPPTPEGMVVVAVV